MRLINEKILASKLGINEKLEQIDNVTHKRKVQETENKFWKYRNDEAIKKLLPEMNDASPYSNLTLGHRPEDKPKAIEYPPNHP